MSGPPSPWGEPLRPADPGPAWPSPAAGAPAPVRTAAARPGPSVARRAVPLPHRRPAPAGPTSFWHRARSLVTLAVIAAVIGAALAGTLGVTVWAIAAAIHHAASN